MTHAKGHENNLQLSKAEGEIAERVAKIHNISVEDAGELIIKRSLEDRVKKRTGKNPAKVYTIKPRK